MKSWLRGFALLICFLPGMSFAISFVNGSSTVGTHVGPGLAVASFAYELETSEDRILARPRSFLSLLSFEQASKERAKLIAHYTLLSDSEALSVRSKLEPTQLGELKGYTGWLDSKRVWLVPNVEGDWVLLFGEDWGLELMDELLGSLHHP